MVSSCYAGAEAETELNVFAKGGKVGSQAGCRTLVSLLLALTIRPHCSKMVPGVSGGASGPDRRPLGWKSRTWSHREVQHSRQNPIAGKQQECDLFVHLGADWQRYLDEGAEPTLAACPIMQRSGLALSVALLCVSPGSAVGSPAP